MQPETRSVIVNGERVACAADDLIALLRERELDPAAKGFVCAVNGVFVPRAAWAQHKLHAGDRVDIVAPVVGG